MPPPPARGRSWMCVQDELHQRVPLILGSQAEVERIASYHDGPRAESTTSSTRRCSTPAPCSVPPALGSDRMSASIPSSPSPVVRRRHHDRDEHLRADLPPREDLGRHHRGRRLPPLRPRRDAGADGGWPSTATRSFSHFGPETNLFEELGAAVPRLRRDRHRTTRASTCTTTTKARALRRRSPAPSRDWEPLPERTDLLFYEGLHGAVDDRQGRRRAPCRSADRRGADHQPGVDPEAAPRPERRAATARRRSSTPSCAACPIT